jgi:hypothetical protein
MHRPFANERVAAVVGALLGRNTTRWVLDVGRGQDRQYRRDGPGISLGRIAWDLSIGLELPPLVASECRVVLELIQPAIDLADNLADEEEDRRLGRRPEARYPRIPPAARPFLPVLAVGVAMQHLVEAHSTDIFDVPGALRRLLAALARLNEVQGRPLGARGRSRDIGAAFLSLACLPIWLAPAQVGAERSAAVGAWAEAYGGVLQPLVDARECPDDVQLARRFRRLRRRAVRGWPEFSPFGPGQALSQARILPDLV